MISTGGTVDVEQRRRPTVRRRVQLLRSAKRPLSRLQSHGLPVRPSSAGRRGNAAAVRHAQHGRSRLEDTVHEPHGAAPEELIGVAREQCGTVLLDTPPIDKTSIVYDNIIYAFYVYAT